MTSDDDIEQQPKGKRSSLFLERQSYRRRRLADAARLLPFLGAALLALPLLWPDQSAGDRAVPLSSAMLYIFACWGVLIAIGLIFGLTARGLGIRDDFDAGTD